MEGRPACRVLTWKREQELDTICGGRIVWCGQKAEVVEA